MLKNVKFLFTLSALSAIECIFVMLSDLGRLYGELAGSQHTRSPARDRGSSKIANVVYSASTTAYHFSLKARSENENIYSHLASGYLSGSVIMSEAFVTLDRYKNDLSRQVHRDKLLIEHLESCLRGVDVSKPYANELIERYNYLLGLLRLPLDFWFTRWEFTHPIQAASRDKFSSVADGVQAASRDKFSSVADGVQETLSF